MAARSPAPLERGPAGDPQADVHLGGDDPRQRGLAEPGRAREEEVVGRLAPPARRGEQDLEVLLQARLADELVEAPGPERDLLRLLHRIGRRRVSSLSSLVARRPRPASSAAFPAHGTAASSRRSSSTEPSSGSCATTSRTSSGA